MCGRLCSTDEVPAWYPRPLGYPPCIFPSSLPAFGPSVLIQRLYGLYTIFVRLLCNGRDTLPSCVTRADGGDKFEWFRDIIKCSSILESLGPK